MIAIERKINGDIEYLSDIYIIGHFGNLSQTYLFR